MRLQLAQAVAELRRQLHQEMMKEVREIEGKLLSDRQGQLHVGSEAAVRILEGDPAVRVVLERAFLTHEDFHKGVEYEEVERMLQVAINKIRVRLEPIEKSFLPAAPTTDKTVRFELDQLHSSQESLGEQFVSFLTMRKHL